MLSLVFDTKHFIPVILQEEEDSIRKFSEVLSNKAFQ